MSDKIRVLVFTTAYAPLVGGAEVATQNIIRRLRNRFDFQIITFRFDRSGPAREEIDGATVWRLGNGGVLDRMLFFPFRAFFQARRLARGGGRILLWSIMISYAGIGAYFFKFFHPQVPFLLTLQEGDDEKHLQYGKFGLLGLWWRLLCARADAIQAISTYLAKRARMSGACGRIEVVPNGVDTSVFQARSPSATDRGSCRIITVSRLVQKNGVDILIRSAVELKKVAPGLNFCIRIVGGGSDEAGLRRLTQVLRVDDVVEFAGEVSQVKLPEELSRADIFVRPSRSEGLGVSFLEAMAAGLPIIATKVGGIPDFLREGENGLYCHIDDPADLAQKIAQLAADADLRTRLGRSGRELVLSEYSNESVAERIGIILDSTANTV